MMKKLRENPILVLLLVNIFIGAFTFQRYGLSWDEPLFYSYADALPYAYSPAEWFSGRFDLNNAYGASGGDHANRGAAYLVLARPLVLLVQSSDVDSAAAWHFVNFLTFQLGVYFLYRLARRFTSPRAALAAAALFAWQPLLWGHAFINPKDPPFLVFFLGAIAFGLEMADAPTKTKIFLAALLLGAATSTRVLGPLAGGLVILYALSKAQRAKLIKPLLLYLTLSIAICIALWPYLWSNPPLRFLEAFGFMSDNPTQLPVLFHGQIYPADRLPRRYLPTLLALTLTEPVLALAALGVIVTFWQKRASGAHLLFLLWFFIPFLYVVLLRPPMYDGYRHFLFMLPPLFLFAGMGLQKIFDLFTRQWLRAALIAALLIPGVLFIIQLHPYQYAYYNSFIGNVGGAFRQYETEYWLTCYKEAVENFHAQNVNLFVKREPYLAAYYAGESVHVRDYRAEFGKIQSGDFVLVNTRSNEDKKTFKDAPVILQIARGGATFCEIKQIP
ncbi:MAG: glycosyltransferase family 39 protein [Anaerolineales bacterium]